MTITVKRLIAALKKQDQNAIVVWQSHDQLENEMEGFVNYVSEAADSLIDKEQIGKLVVLRP